MFNWEQVKLTEATLDQYSQALIMSEGWGAERAFIKQFFTDAKGVKLSTVSMEKELNYYHHTVAQFVMEDWFEKQLGFKKVVEATADFGSASDSATWENIKRSPTEYFKGYAEGTIGYEKGTERLMVRIEDEHDEGSKKYHVISAPERSNVLTDWLEYGRKNNFYKNQKINAMGQFLEVANLTWEDVILPEGTKNLLRTMVTRYMSKRDVYDKNRLRMKRGVMITGKPGNGKTSLLKVITRESPITVISAMPCHMTNARAVREICVMARDLAPCILIIEDIDWIAEDREESGDSGRVIELMNQLDGLESFNNVITIATTNCLDKIEAAIKNRPGRFDRVITINDPDSECRAEMLRVFCKHWILAEDINREVIVDFANGLSGAHMQDLCITAAENALRDDSLNSDGILVVRQAHFADAISEVKDKDYSSYMQLKSNGEKRPMGFHHMYNDD